MATDGPTPGRCNPEVYTCGTLLMVTHSIPSNAMEGWVRKVAARSGQPVDWHFAGGRACILALGDLGRVREAIQALLPEHDELQRQAVAAMGLGPAFMDAWQPSCTLYGPREWNPAHELLRQENLKRGAEDA